MREDLTVTRDEIDLTDEIAATAMKAVLEDNIFRNMSTMRI
jgi:hypothetical protein